jgi:predicted SAM-dependent methyltransferase
MIDSNELLGAMHGSYLNLGCGSRYLSTWQNVDFVSKSEQVLAANLIEGIPFQNNRFDVVYHSHVLEHFRKEDAPKFLKECHRVLKKEGVIRVVVPNLEPIARNYLHMLDCVKEDNTTMNRANYEWAVIEMFDQTVRTESGGEMAKFWKQPTLINESWIIERVGNEFTRIRDYLLAQNSKSVKLPEAMPRTWKQQVKKKLLIKLLGEPRYEELIQYARFREGGEIHQWMYDSYSLGQLLTNAGFRDVRIASAFESNIENWEQHMWLDVENGTARKPDSLFMEGRK